MKRTFLFPLSFCLLLGLFASHPANAQQDKPTAPPPPNGLTAQPPPNGGGGDNSPTNTPKRAYPYPTRTPSTTPTLSVTPTITPTVTLTPTPTPAANLRIHIYLDANQNGAFDSGEGVDGLRVLAQAENWQAEQVTSRGQAWFTPPWNLPAGTAVQVEVPYLHWNETLSLAAQDQIASADIPLAMPVLPLYLP